MSRQALEGLKVVEVGNIVAGPWCGSMLADFGARVIKVEPPKTGDLMRGMGRIKNLRSSPASRSRTSILPCSVAWRSCSRSTTVMSTAPARGR